MPRSRNCLNPIADFRRQIHIRGTILQDSDLFNRQSAVRSIHIPASLREKDAQVLRDLCASAASMVWRRRWLSLSPRRHALPLSHKYSWTNACPDPTAQIRSKMSSVPFEPNRATALWAARERKDHKMHDEFNFDGRIILARCWPCRYSKRMR